VTTSIPVLEVPFIGIAEAPFSRLSRREPGS